jgi:hypothetical protein
MSLKHIRVLTGRGVLAEILISLENALKAMWYDGVVQRVDSVQPDGETYDYVGGVTGMQEKKGDPEFGELGVFEFFIKNIMWECALRIHKVDWDHGRRGIIQQKIDDQTTLAAIHPGQLVQTCLNAGGASACSDGEFYFDTDHPTGSTTQSNIVTATTNTPSKPSEALVIDALLDAVVRMWSLKDDKGNEINVGLSKFMVTCGPTLFPILTKSLGKSLVNGGESNIVHKNQKFELVPQLLPGLTGNKFQVLAMDVGARPFVLQVLDDPAPEMLGRDSEYCKLKDHLLFMVKGAYNVGYGRYQRAVEVRFEQG